MSIQQPVAIPTSTLLVDDLSNLVKTLDTYGVAVIPLKKISTGHRNRLLMRTKFYANAHQILKPEYQIKELTLKEKCHPETIKPRKAPTPRKLDRPIRQPLHHLIEQDQDFRDAMEVIEGKPVTKYMQNRMRLGTKKFGVDATSLHFDGHPFEAPDETGQVSFTKNPLTATIIGLTGTRRFCWWDIKGKNLKPIYDHWVKRARKHLLI